MAEVLKKATFRNPYFWVCLIISIGLMIGGFFTPPMAEIPGSCLEGVGWLFGFATLGVVLHAIDRGLDVKVKHGNTEATIGDIVHGTETKE